MTLGGGSARLQTGSSIGTKGISPLSPIARWPMLFARVSVVFARRARSRCLLARGSILLSRSPFLLAREPILFSWRPFLLARGSILFARLASARFPFAKGDFYGCEGLIYPPRARFFGDDATSSFSIRSEWHSIGACVFSQNLFPRAAGVQEQ